MSEMIWWIMGGYLFIGWLHVWGLCVLTMLQPAYGDEFTATQKLFGSLIAMMIWPALPFVWIAK